MDNKTILEEPTLIFNKVYCDLIARQRAEGDDPFPGYKIIESRLLPIPAKDHRHPFVAFIKGRTT